MITPKIKDKVLAALIAEFENTGEEYIELPYLDVFPEHEITPAEYSSIIDQFQRMGIIKETKGYIGGCLLRRSADMYDLHSHGGFAAQELIFRANLEKLGYELDELSKDTRLSDIVQKLSAAASLIEVVGNIIINNK
ncbi:hypothetical protein Barb6XT_03134 [Bacteroidales bacterium Barb6XT]|nr:hypothetical protein Barb6XT_03134 [Bacteroidales bacterium Barb6XT]